MARWDCCGSLGPSALVAAVQCAFHRSYTLVALVPHWSAVLVGMLLFLAWSGLSLPATFSLIATSLVADRHATGVAVQSVIKRLPIIIGPLLGGMLIDRFGVVPGVRIALLVSIARGILTVVVQRRIREEATAHGDPTGNFLGVLSGFPPPLRSSSIKPLLALR